jgi:GAF domain-containing protein
MARPAGRRSSLPSGENRVLQRIISTVASSLELEEVLQAVVNLLSDASGVHACFVYLVEDDGRRLVLRAAGDPYAHLVGEIALERGEGLAWWALEHGEPAFIRDNLLADPRVKYVPELEEERFQSLISVPILGREAEPIGVISMHTEAPREFTDDEVEFVVSSASLVARAIENARLYEETRRRVAELEGLTELAEAIVQAETLEQLLPEVASRARKLLQAESCHLYLLDGGDDLRLRASDPAGAAARGRIGLGELGPELAHRGRRSSLAVPLVADDELLGLLTADGTPQIGLARAVANQAAVAIKKIELIERLTEKNLIKDFFEQLAGGRVLGLEGRAARLGCDLDLPHLVLAAGPADDELERALAGVAPRSVFDRRDDSVRALLRVPAAGAEKLAEAVRRAHAGLERPVSIGLSNPCRGASSFAAGFEEARHALVGATVIRAAPSVTTYDELGAYKYLLRMSTEGSARDEHREAVARLAAYDRQRSTALVRTLEEFLRRRGNISATADALYVHPNTLRQRLRRIGEISGLDLRSDDWLMVEIALKLEKLQQALETGALDTPSAEQV